MLRSRKNNNGFSLVEIVVAMIILSIVAISSMMIFQSMQKVNEKSKEYADGEIFGNSLVDGLESLYYRDFLHEAGESETDKKYDSMIVDSKLKTDIGYEKIDNYSMLNDGSIIFDAYKGKYKAKVTITKDNSEINTVKFPTIDSLNAEETYVINLSNQKASGLNTQDGTTYDEMAANYFIEQNKIYISQLLNDDSKASYTNLTQEDVEYSVERCVNITLSYKDGYTDVEEELIYTMDKDINDIYFYLPEDKRVYTITVPLHQQMIKNLYLVYGLPLYKTDQINFKVEDSYADYAEKNNLKLFIMAQNARYITGNVNDITFDTDKEYANKVSLYYKASNTVRPCINVYSNSTVMKQRVNDLHCNGFQYTKDGKYTDIDTDHTDAYAVKEDVKLFHVNVQVYDETETNIYSKNGTSILR